jgi:hypothetical protein
LVFDFSAFDIGLIGYVCGEAWMGDEFYVLGVKVVDE